MVKQQRPAISWLTLFPLHVFVDPADFYKKRLLLFVKFHGNCAPGAELKPRKPDQLGMHGRRRLERERKTPYAHAALIGRARS